MSWFNVMAHVVVYVMVYVMTYLITLMTFTDEINVINDNILKDLVIYVVNVIHNVPLLSLIFVINNANNVVNGINT